MELFKYPFVRNDKESAMLTVMDAEYGLTYFHVSCGVLTCSAATGWRNKRVREPKSVCPFTQTLFNFSFSSGVRAWYFMYRK
jgi:hypothetical protein